MLLNVSMSIRAFYDLQGISSRLEAGLRPIEHNVALDVATDDEIRDRVAALYG
jgi:hypothetical protein